MALQCLVFDCDGVLLDSVPIKTRAYARIAEPFGPEARDRMVLYHTRHGGVSRYKKFAWFYQEVLGREISPEESDALARQFVDYSLEEVRRCPFIPGAEETLRRWRGVLPMYVCSGAPDEEVKAVLRERGLKDYFIGIHGSPPAKAEVLRRIVAPLPLAPEDALMGGDAPTDRDAAAQVGTLFYGVGPELQGGEHPWGPDLTGLNEWIAARV